ncbi:MAG: hypothetical protein IT242_11510, partial [Bacteroidia bacterium]|nr:hypothetical protein [Bacteroidia bacterium]
MKFPTNPSHDSYLRFPAVCLVMLLLSFYSFSQSNPSPQSLPYSQDFGTAAFSSMPAGTAAWNGISGNATTTQTAAENSTP